MKDQLIYELGEKGVTASYDSTTGLLGLISHIADIQGGEAILLTTNKNILSYADSETATLTAVHSGGSGKSLSVYNAVSGSKIGDMTDNQDGTYSYTYNSSGVGDISMTCATLTGESNSVTIEDCLKYVPLINSTDTILNTNVSSPFQLSFTLYSDNPTADPSYGFIRFNNSSGPYIGKGASSSANFTFGGSTFNTITANTNYDYVLTYNNGSTTLVCGSTTSTKNIGTISKVYLASANEHTQFKNLKIKPL